MTLEVLETALTVCKVASLRDIHMDGEIFFIGKTDEEISLVCATADVPENTLAREDGWRAFRVQGVLDFSLVGILARISGQLADAGISIFALSTYNTDYILVKEPQLDLALQVLEARKAGSRRASRCLE